MIKMRRAWAMPDSETFNVKPIREFVGSYLTESECSVDPFARNCDLATHTNDINPDTTAQRHYDAGEYLGILAAEGVKADLIIFDPPYSPRQISECYQSIGMDVNTESTQNAALYSRVRDAMMSVLSPGGTVLSFGWNSGGMGRKRGFEIVEILLVCHGGAHNDTICMAERLIQESLF